MNEYNNNPNSRQENESGYHNADNQIYRDTSHVGYPPVRKKRKGLAGIIISVCLACIIFGGAVGIGSYQIWNAINGIQIVVPQNNTASPAPTLEVYTANNMVSTPPVSEYSGDVMTAPQIYAAVIDSCVGITTPIVTTNIWGVQVSNAISGSGFIISQDGYIVTNYHVVETAQKQNLEIKVMLYNNEEYSARIVGFEKDNDVALLKIDATGLKPAVMGSLDNMYVGDNVYVIGNPLGMLTWTMTDGIVSAFEREMQAEKNSSITINMFQISAAINSGNSGGPVFNDRGEVIGIASMKYAASGVEGLGFAIPINDVTPMFSDFIEYGYVKGRPAFGITVYSTSALLNSPVEGAYIDEVSPGSCADKAGLKPGDIIIKLDDYEIASTADLSTAKKNYRAGDSVVVTVYRDGGNIMLELVFDESQPTE